MNFDFDTNTAVTNNTSTASPAINAEKPVLPAEMVQADEYKAQLMKRPEVQALTNEINIQDTNSVLVFGQKPAEGISKIADEILSGMRAVDQEEAAEMMAQLTRLMDKFDIKDFENMQDNKNLVGRMFKKLQAQFDKTFRKYEDLGKEVDGIAVILKKYMADIQKSNNDLQKQYNAEVEYYKMLEQYIAAGRIALQEIDAFDKTIDSNPSMDENTKQMRHTQLAMVRDALDTRILDLQTAENVAIQACPMIQTMQVGNYNLMRKINSSFIITLPVFKQCMIQAIQLKRQQIQAKSIADLDAKTNELLLRNAKNTAGQSVQIAKMAGTSSIQVETLRKTAETIRNGITETKNVMQEQAAKRVQDSKELDVMAEDMKKTSVFSS